jgi:hypothetical protein
VSSRAVEHSADQPSDEAQKRSNTEAPTMNATQHTHDSTDTEQHGDGEPATHPFAGASIPTARDAIAYARDDGQLIEVEHDDDQDDRVWFEGEPHVVRAFANATDATTTLASGGFISERVAVERGTPERPEADRERAAAVRERLMAE